MKVLWLASWYPGSTHATNGDFVERQAKAVAQRAPVTVLFVTKDENLPFGAEQCETVTEGNLTVYRVYYSPQLVGGRWGGWLEKLLSVKKYLALQKKYYHQIVQQKGQPTLVHVQVAMKAGLLALWLKRKYQIPFVVTEHWTGYYPQSTPSIYQQNPLYRRLNKKILQQADRLLPVSAHLGQTINTHFVAKPFMVIPNVVDTQLFFYQAMELPVFRFIHPSYLNYQKNPEGMLRACQLAVGKGLRFELWLVGNEDAGLMRLADELGLLDRVVFFKPMQTYAAVAALMPQSSALLLFSRFENLPCVVLEALCCGLPVISSRVGGIHEVVNDGNGILVPSEDEAALAEAMEAMIAGYDQYDRKSIAASAAAQFGYATVALQFVQVYQQIMGK
jgi:glycosyltransferase involved in cell wall biosynthesis